MVTEYQYLGLKLKASGSFSPAVEELQTKASRAFFSISNILYRHKKWPVDRSMGLFDTLVSPISLYACELWAPLVLPGKSFRNIDSIIAAWQQFQPELLNQKACRLLLGVHRKASRLAVLGELGRYPMFIRAISHALKYEWHVTNNVEKSSLVFLAVQEMKTMSDVDNGWYTRIKKIKEFFNIPNFSSHAKPDFVGKKIKNIMESQFSNWWKKEVSFSKIGEDGINHNKLRFYTTLKSSFTIEPYVQSVINRNQRNWITRLRISAHTLRIEQGRYTVPVTPINERICKYCECDIDNRDPRTNNRDPYIDDETHFLLNCDVFDIKRSCLFGKISSIDKKFASLSAQQKLATLLCPSNNKIAKLVNKFINIMFDARKRIDMGENIDRGQFTDYQANESAFSETSFDE